MLLCNVVITKHSWRQDTNQNIKIPNLFYLKTQKWIIVIIYSRIFYMHEDIDPQRALPLYLICIIYSFSHCSHFPLTVLRLKFNFLPYSVMSSIFTITAKTEKTKTENMLFVKISMMSFCLCRLQYSYVFQGS